jgi:hypothetical protein
VLTRCGRGPRRAQRHVKARYRFQLDDFGGGVMLQENAIAAAVVSQLLHPSFKRFDEIEDNLRIFDRVVEVDPVSRICDAAHMSFADIDCVQQRFGAGGEYFCKFGFYNVGVGQYLCQLVFDTEEIGYTPFQSINALSNDERQSAINVLKVIPVFGLECQAVAFFDCALLVGRCPICEPATTETEHASQQRFAGPINKAISGNNADCDTSEKGSDQGYCLVYLWDVHHGTVLKRLIVSVSTAGSAASSYLKGVA